MGSIEHWSNILILVFLVLLFILFQLKNEPLRNGFDIVVKKLEDFKNVASYLCEQYPNLMLMCGTFIMIVYARLAWVNHTYECTLLWCVGFSKRNGLDMVMTRRILMSMTGLMTLVVIEIQRITNLIFWSWMFVGLVSLVVVTYENDTFGFK